MRSSDALFQLVKSLSKGEKRYFRLVAERYEGEKKYMLLFDEIDRCAEYDEDRIREHVAPQADPKQFHVIKNYLLELILRSLRSYEARSSRRAQLQTLLSNITLLYNRGIFSQAQRLLRQAESIARELDNPGLKLEVIELRIRLAGKGRNKEDWGNDAHAARMETVHDLELRYRYLDLRAQMEELLVALPGRSPERDRAADSIVDHPLLAHPPAEGSCAVRNLYHQTLSLYHHAKEDDRATLESMMRSKEIYDGNPARRSSYIAEYVILLGNMLQLTMRMEEYALHEELLCALTNIPQEHLLRDVVSPARAKGIYLETLYSARLHLYTRRGEFERCIRLEPEIDSCLRQIPVYRHSSNRRYHHLLLAWAYFGLGEHDSALRLLHDTVNDKEPTRGRALYYSARLLQLLIHYELGHYDLAASLERSLRSRLTDRELMEAYEAEVLRFFRCALSGAWGTKEEKEEGKGRLFGSDIYEQPHGTGVFSHIDFAAWMEARRRGILLSDVLRSRFERKSRRAVGL